MNIRRQKGKIRLSEEVNADVARISAIWKDMRIRSGGPFLFGEFSAADAMFAPVVNRFDIYDLTEDPAVLAYMEAMKAHPAWIKWQEAALKESWVVEEDEV